MKRLITFALAACFCTTSLSALSIGASATPSYETPDPWTYRALDVLAADGLIEGYPNRSFQGDRPRTRREMAVLIARVISKLQTNGVGDTSKNDLERLQRLADAFRDELVLLGIRVKNVDAALQPPDKRPKAVPGFEINGRIAADDSFRQRTFAPQTGPGGTVDPFTNAFLTSPADNSPFEHDPGPGNLLRFDNKFDPTYAFNDNVAISLPTRMIQYDRAFTLQDKYLIQPALVVNVGQIGALRNAYLRAGQLDNIESSRLGLTYRAPDETQQGPGFQNPVQPYENGVAIGGVLSGSTRFQFSWSLINQSLINSEPDQYANNNYFLVVTPPQSSAAQFGAVGVAPTGTMRTDSFMASAGPVLSVYLSNKAAPGSVYISAVNGTVCSAGGLTPGGTTCPIASGSWYYIDETNQVVFRSPLPVGTSIQITYSTATGTTNQPRYNFEFQRQHFNARVNHEVSGLPGTEIGLSLSRIVDARDTSNQPPVYFGNGYGAVSDTVFGLDARVPLPLFSADVNRSQPLVIFGEGAYSKYSPDIHNTPAITDSALVLGVRLNLAMVRATVQYQNVGPNFLDGAPIRYLGPAPATFLGWRGNYFPEFFGFANNRAINQTFDATVTPGCIGTACTSRNPALTYIYPVFNPFVASGPQFFSAFAPNSRGLTANLALPIGGAQAGTGLRFAAQHLAEVVPNGFGQIAYGPGFSTGTKLKFDRLEGGLQVGVPVFGSRASVNVTAAFEHLFRNDKTAYAYLPFNPATGGPDASSQASNNAFLSMAGNTPVLFYPNFIDMFRTTLTPGVSVPVTRDMTIGLAYSTQRYRGSNGTVLDRNILQRRDESFATLTYNIPNSTSSVGVLFGNQKYTDSIVPAFNFNQNREGMNFTVRF